MDPLPHLGGPHFSKAGFLAYLRSRYDLSLQFCKLGSLWPGVYLWYIFGIFLMFTQSGVEFILSISIHNYGTRLQVIAYRANHIIDWEGAE